ncbi:MAG: PTS sugar transporter subunit IIA [Treponema sp.]|nr:PTS sugar transporter subunit IIA [Treponema sp.]
MGKSLSDIFDLRSIKLDFDGKTKELALAELIDSISVLHPECDSKELFTVIMEREKKMSTGIGNGVAIPHAGCKGIANMSGAIGVSKQGIDYGALDQKPVHIVFLFATSEKADENHLRILNLIFKLAMSREFELIKNANNAEEVHAILSRVHL